MKPTQIAVLVGAAVATLMRMCERKKIAALPPVEAEVPPRPLKQIELMSGSELIVELGKEDGVLFGELINFLIYTHSGLFCLDFPVAQDLVRMKRRRLEKDPASTATQIKSDVAADILALPNFPPEKRAAFEKFLMPAAMEQPVASSEMPALLPAVASA